MILAPNALISERLIETEITSRLIAAFGMHFVASAPPTFAVERDHLTGDLAVKVSFRELHTVLVTTEHERALSLHDFSRRNVSPLVNFFASKLSTAPANEDR